MNNIQYIIRRSPLDNLQGMDMNTLKMEMVIIKLYIIPEENNKFDNSGSFPYD